MPSRLALLLRLFTYSSLLLGTNAQAQMIGTTQSGAESPTEVKPAALTPSVLQGDVDLFTGTYSASYPLGSVSTPAGPSFALSLQYSPTIAGGTTPTLQDGIPYGEGWSLNIPTITVSNAYVHHLTPSEESTIRAQQANGGIAAELVTFNQDLQQPNPDPVPALTDGYGVWFAPMLNIPGVASGRLVFKRFENDGAVFVLNTFDTYVEAHFTGSTWEVHVSDGRVFEFGAQLKAVQMPQNKRWSNYEELDELMRTAPGTSSAAVVKGKILNALKPRMHTLQWYCSSIYDPLHAPGQSILFEYSSHGCFDMYRELQQSYYMQRVSLDLRPSGNDVISFENPLNGFPDVTTCQELLLRRVSASTLQGELESIELEHRVDGPGPAGQMVQPDATTYSTGDPMYLAKVVYRAGTFGQDQLGFNNWRRYPHYASDDFPKGGLTNFTVNRNNPYIGTTSQGLGYYALDASTSGSQLPFNHSFLESAPIEPNEIWPGDFWEVRTTINGGPTPQHFDINVVTGYGEIGLGAVGEVFYNGTRGKTLFTTFDRILKWNNMDAGGMQEEYTTSNIFLMPYVANVLGDPQSGNNGIRIQVGPSNSDTDYGMADDLERLTIPNTDEPSAYNSYYHAKWARFPTSIPNTGSSVLGLRSHDPVPGNFGIGLPWSPLLYTHRHFGDNVYVPGYEDPWVAEGMKFWWSNGDPYTMPWGNTPTLAGPGSKLKNVELIRYGKQPYLLHDVKKYVRHGEQTAENLHGRTLVQHQALSYQRTAMAVPKRHSHGAATAPMVEPFGRQLYELVSVEEVPTWASTGGIDPGGPVPIQPVTRFAYLSAASFIPPPAEIECDGLNYHLPDPYYHLVAGGRVLEGITDPLGQQTRIVYNDPLDFTLSDFQVLDNFHPGFFSKSDPNQTATICDDIVTLSPVTGAITPSVKELRKSDENGAEDRIWSYSYANKRARNRSTPLGSLSTANIFSENQCYRFNRFGGITYGYERTTVDGPDLGGDTRVRRIHHFHVTAAEANIPPNPEWPQSANLNFTVPAVPWPPVDISTPDYHLWGRLHKIEVRDPLNRLLETTETQYEVSPAYENGWLRDAKGKRLMSIYAYDYMDMHEEFVPDDDLMTERPELDAQPGVYPGPRFLEYGTPDSNSKYHVDFPDEYLNSYLIKKLKETHTQYDPDGCGIAATAPPNPTAAAVKFNPNGTDPGNTHTTTDAAALLSSLETNGLSESMKAELISRSPLQEVLVEKAIDVADANSAARLKEVLGAQERLTDDRLLQTIDKADVLDAGKAESVILEQPWLTDAVIAEVMTTSKLTSDEKTRILLEQPHIATALLPNLLGAGAPLTSAETERVLLAQPPLTTDFLLALVTDEHLPSEVKAAVLIAQPLLAPTLFDAVELDLATWSPTALEDLLVHGSGYPDEAFLEALLQHATDWPAEVVRNILAADPQPFSTGLRSGIDAAPMLREEDRAYLLANAPSPLLQYCGNPCTTMNLKVRNVTEYAYYDAAPDGTTTSPAWRNLLGLEDAGAVPTIQLKWEPSWLLYRTRAYSPEYPGAVTDNEYFYLQDLRNRYDRHWNMLTTDIDPRFEQIVEDGYSPDPDEHFNIVIPVVLFAPGPPEHSPFSYDPSHNCQPGLQYSGPYQAPRIEILSKMHEFGLLSDKFYEHRMVTKNNRSTEPLVRSEYFQYSSRWNWEDLPTYTFTQVDEPCPSIISDGLLPQSERRFHDPYTAVPGLNDGNWQQFLDDLPPGHSLVKAGNGTVGMIKNTALAESTGYTVLHAGSGTASESGNPKLEPFASLLKRAILLRAVYTQADERVATTYTDKRLFTEERPLMHFAQLEPASTEYTCIEWLPLLPYPSLRNQLITERNWHTQPMLVENERGLRTRLNYDHPSVAIITEIDGDDCTTNWFETLIAPGKPTSITVGDGLPEPLQQTTSFTYAMGAELETITDPNGLASGYAYDGFGRLWKSYRDGELLGVNTYHQWDGTEGTGSWATKHFDRTAQNYTESIMRRERASMAGVRTRSFMDPNGRAFLSLAAPISDIEDPSEEATEVQVSGLQAFDAWDRVTQAFKPDLRANGTGGNNFALTTALASTSGLAFAATRYEADHRSRPLEAAAPGEPLITGHTRKTRYQFINHIAFACDLKLSAVEAGLLMPGNAADYVWIRTETEDEDGNIARSYANALGQQVATAGLIDGATKAITLFLYDDQGALTRVINPEKQHATYEQNILGLTYRKRTVDGGVTAYMYDQSGNVVLEQDANGAAGEADPSNLGAGDQPILRPWFRRTHFDVFNRPVKQERVRLYHPAANGYGPGTIYSYPVNPLAYTSHDVDFADPDFGNDPAIYLACWPDGLVPTPCYFHPFSSASTLSYLARYGVLASNPDPNNNSMDGVSIGIDALPPDPVLDVCLPPWGAPPALQPMLTDALLEKTWDYDLADVTASGNLPVNTLFPNVAYELLTQRPLLRGRLSHTVAYPHRQWADYTTETDPVSGVQHWQGEAQAAVHYDFRSYNEEGRLAWQLQQFNANTITPEARGMLIRLDYPDYDLLGNLRTVNVDVNHDMQLDMQQHYTYDDWGRLKDVYLNVNDQGAGGNKLASHSYNLALGLLSNVQYFAEDCATPGLHEQVGGYALSYDVRDRLTALQGPHYAEQLAYDGQTVAHPVTGNLQGHLHHNGSINGLVHTYTLDPFANYDNTRFEEPTRHAFQYDGLGRMTRADAVVGDLVLGLNDPSHPHFRVGDEFDNFDRIGNFRQVLRYSLPPDAPAPQMLSWLYQYSPATSRLLQVQAGSSSQVPSRNYTYDAAGNLLTDPARRLQGSTYGRAHLPFRLHLPTATSNYEARYHYDAADQRVYKRYAKVNGAVETQAFHLRDASGRELGVLDLAGGAGENDPLTGQWTWYAFGAQRFAKVRPQQQPELLVSDLGRQTQLDQDQALYQALHTWLLQQHAQPGGMAYPQTPYFVRHTEGGAFTPYTEAQYYALAEDPAFAALRHTAFRLLDDHSQLTLKRHSSEEELVISVAELLGMGQAKSGGNGVPFTYANPYENASLAEVTYYLHDHLGNTRVTYTAGCKSEGQTSLPIREFTLVHAADYHPYGSILREWRDGPAEKYLTTHHERDTETGLDYRGARYYDADVARFLSLDPLAAEFASWSAYNYVMGNPISLTDPSGRSATKYEDEAGNFLGNTNDGNDATVTVGNANVDSFKKEFAQAEGRNEQNGMMKNESWIRRYGDRMSVEPGGKAASWAAGALGYYANALIPAAIGTAATALEENAAQILLNRARYDFKGAPYEPLRFPTKNVTVRTPFGGLEMPKSTLAKIGLGLKVGGYAMGAYQAVDLYNQKQQGLIGGSTYYLEQGTNAFATFGGIYGAAWSVGWESGRYIMGRPAVRDWMQNTWYPWREQNLGY